MIKVVYDSARGLIQTKGDTGGFEISGNLVVNGSIANSSNTVATMSALRDVAFATLQNGTLSYVDTFKDFFYWDSTSTLTHDGVTIVSPSSSPASGRWVRANQQHPYWATYSTWYVDWVSGNDESAGNTLLTAIKSPEELRRRLDNQILLQNTVVWIVSTIPSTNPIELFVRLRSTMLNIRGVRTVTRAGTIAACTVPVPSTHTASTLTDNSVPTDVWTPDINLLATEVGTNKSVWIESDVGAKTARTSYPYTFSAGSVTTTFTATTLTPGNSYQIVSFPQVTWGHVDAVVVGTSGARSRVHIDGLNISGVVQRASKASSIYGVFYECKFVDSAFQTDFSAQGCYLQSGVSLAPGSGGAVIGGLTRGAITLNGSTGVCTNLLCVGTSASIASSYSLSTLSGIGVFGVSGNALAVTFGGSVIINGDFYGNGNGLFGLNVGPGSFATLSAGKTINATGASGDMKIGLTGSCVSINAADGTFVPLRVASWTNWAASVVSGGFGGTLTDPLSGARVLPGL